MNIAPCYRTLLEEKCRHRSINLACTKAGEHTVPTHALREQAATDAWISFVTGTPTTINVLNRVSDGGNSRKSVDTVLFARAWPPTLHDHPNFRSAFLFFFSCLILCFFRGGQYQGVATAQSPAIAILIFAFFVCCGSPHRHRSLVRSF
jgi:hypothetical protein